MPALGFAFIQHTMLACPRAGRNSIRNAVRRSREALETRPLSRGYPCGYPHKPLVSYRINRQLSGWIFPPLMIRAFGGALPNADVVQTHWLIFIAVGDRRISITTEKFAQRVCRGDASHTEIICLPALHPKLERKLYHLEGDQREEDLFVPL
jgi:hypothetical protein